MKGEGETMRALMLEGPGQLAVRQIPIPVPKDGQVLIQVLAAPINPSDLYFIKEAEYGSGKKAPCIAGFQGSGVVIKNGGGIMGWGLVNKKVAFTPTEASGTYTQFAIAKSSECLPVDKDMSFDHAAMSFVNPLTAMAMLDLAEKQKAKAVIVNAAASSLGRMLNRYLPPEGIEIINIVRRQQQVDLLRKEGATHILNSEQPNFIQKLTELATSLKAKICYDAIGGSMTGTLLSCMPPKSIVHVYGLLSGQNISNVHAKDLLYHGKTITGLFLPNWLKEKGMIKLVPTLVKLRSLLMRQLKSQIAMQCTLDDGPQGIKYYVNNMSKGKVLIKPFLDRSTLKKQIKEENQQKQKLSQQKIEQNK